MKTLLLLTALTAIGLESKATDIDGATIAMDSLMACQESRTNGQTMSEMIRKKQRPIRKGEATWTYAAKGTVTTSKAALLKAHGIDYTQERRDAESGAPVRAILSKTDKPGESMLYCDSGNL